MGSVVRTEETGFVSVPYFIRKVTLTDGGPELVKFDWVLAGGMESDEYFATVDEARKDVQSYFE